MLLRGDITSPMRSKDVRRLPCSDHLKEVIHRCLGSRGRRYEAAGELIAALRHRPKELRKGRVHSLAGKRLALIVDDGGWRNTTAFELGIQAMGGVCARPPARFGAGEATADLAKYLDNWFDVLVVRTRELSILRELASSADAPVINARTRSNHPCETLGDLAYIRSKSARAEERMRSSRRERVGR